MFVLTCYSAVNKQRSFLKMPSLGMEDPSSHGGESWEALLLKIDVFARNSCQPIRRRLQNKGQAPREWPRKMRSDHQATGRKPWVWNQVPGAGLCNQALDKAAARPPQSTTNIMKSSGSAPPSSFGILSQRCFSFTKELHILEYIQSFTVHACRISYSTFHNFSIAYDKRYIFTNLI